MSNHVETPAQPEPGSDQPATEPFGHPAGSHTWRNLAFSAGLVAAALACGTIASRPDDPWYVRLDKPAWQPPRAAFPIVWTALYASIAAGSTLTLNRLDDQSDAARKSWFHRKMAINLTTNAAWTWIFFRAHNLPLAALGAAALAGDSVALSIRAGKVRPAAGAVLAPYGVWTTFATALATEVWRRNRA